MNQSREEALFALARLLFECHKAQPLNVLEVTAIERGHFAPTQSCLG